ncbi:putative virion associated protein [Cestrum yellow leaf curling virus]|uniref:Uncharacterized protein 3 n=1 Tax=Cestrum yellow leaf curling virus TaxID=175814 RepID=Y3_CYLCV|nr:putative virion associated protein [Cestrum yellow leaf curling virus]Q7TD10.1 RecName: Full=Uncharacterized protein 3 [Cestrum yellow leaf curling virus]AAP78922.1 putative virion associated protein [Cestrum yellow leaf curling virus]
MGLEDSVKQLQGAIEELKGLISSVEEMKEIVKRESEDSIQEYLRSFLEPLAKDNPLFTQKHIFGKYKPERNEKKCSHIDGNYWPHLKHTFHPQLNYIVDLLEEIRNCTCKEKQHDKQLVPLPTPAESSKKPEECTNNCNCDKCRQKEKCLTIGEMSELLQNLIKIPKQSKYLEKPALF